MLGDNLSTGYFLRYPYWDSLPGSMCIPEQGGRRYRQWDGEAAIEYADNLDNLSRLGLHLRISTTSRFDFETNWNSFTEETHAGRDHLTLGDADVLFRFAQSDELQLRSGLGANWLDDHDGAFAGFNFRYGADWYPAKPLAIKGLIDLGEIGKAGMVHARLTLGVLYQRWEIFTGYDFRQIGDTRICGPLAGVQFRF